MLEIAGLIFNDSNMDIDHESGVDASRRAAEVNGEERRGRFQCGGQRRALAARRLSSALEDTFRRDRVADLNGRVDAAEDRMRTLGEDPSPSLDQA
jgi:hypothetical protein